MKRCLFFVLLIICLFLVSCVSITEGVVVDKYYEPAYSWVQLMPMPVGKTTMLFPITHYVSERWVICIEKDSREGCVDTSQARWDKTKLGDYITFKN
jgi:hypothetical protein